jgi:hypothetical protein
MMCLSGEGGMDFGLSLPLSGLSYTTTTSQQKKKENNFGIGSKKFNQ